MKTLTFPSTGVQNNSFKIALFNQFKIYRTLFTVTFIGLIQLTGSAYGQTTDTVHVTPLTSTGVCLENRFSTKFTTPGMHHITIQASINLNGSPLLNTSCNDTVFKPYVYIEFDSATVVPNSQASDTLNESWSCEINVLDSATIWYRVYIDCSVIPPNNTGSQNINLVQEFTDPTNYFIYSIGGNNTFEVSNINTPRIVEPPILNVPSSYLNYSQVNFLYVNTGSAPIEIEFSFSPDSTSYCG